MNTIVNSLSNYSTFFTRNDLQPLLPPQTRKIVAVAALAFACLAAAVYIGMRCFKANKIQEDLKSPLEESKKIDKSPSTPAEEFKEKEIEFKQQFDQAKTVSEKLAICEKFTVAIYRFSRYAFSAPNTTNEAIIQNAEELRLKMVIGINQIDFSSEELDLEQQETLKFNKAFIETLVKTKETIAAKEKAIDEARSDREKIFKRHNDDPSDPTLNADRKKNAEKCIQVQQDFRATFKALRNELQKKYNDFILNADSPCSEKIYKTLDDQLYTLADATLEPGVYYFP